MSKILQKPFDAAKRIYKTIFRGTPNLMTSEDLNRQIDALLFRLDEIEKRNGVIIDGSIPFQFSSGVLLINPDIESILIQGCTFTRPVGVGFSTPITSEAYLVATLTSKTYNYNNDETHEISGAKFDDGTSMAAADQMVYNNITISVSTSKPINDNRHIIIAHYRKTENNVVLEDRNYYTTDEFLGMRIGHDTLRNFLNELPIGNVTYAVQNGQTIDYAISVLNFLIKAQETAFETWKNDVYNPHNTANLNEHINIKSKIEELKTQLTQADTNMGNALMEFCLQKVQALANNDLTTPWTPLVGGNGAEFKFGGGTLFLNFPARTWENGVSKNGAPHFYVASFPGNFSNLLKSYASGVFSGSSNTDVFYVGNLGTFFIYNPAAATDNVGDTGSTHVDGRIGLGHLTLCIPKSNDNGEVSIVAYVDSAINFQNGFPRLVVGHGSYGDDNLTLDMLGLANASSVKIHIPKHCTMLPLPGLSGY